ncbi:AAA family ATPase [Lactiplantibacillus sp. WILCCON 0030]|uniref:AAA family ATPase n=1 Tax=Lactiplantibacillus brownii TaxID=3069269 RepID=A0ABU1A8B2_9LACO|nr:AAA family ATPase [Lactiplantibacillus brownii]MDQ7937166.1 AAA family ATPase [Lactiplantibacillus brownii]
MQISKIEIAGFGKFHDQTFELSAGLQVIYGANETGKSTLRAFILGMLFGFPTRRQLIARYEPKQTTQYGGALELVVSGQRYRLTRLGDQAATLLNLTTQESQPLSLLDQWLAPYDETSYKQLFTFNQAELTALKTLSATDLNTQLQQVGTRGSVTWRETANELRASADELYKPRGRKPALNQALKQYQTLKQQVQTAQQHYPEYQQLQAQIQQLAADKSRLTRELTSDAAEQQRLAELRNQWPVYQQIQQLKAIQPEQGTLSPATVAQYDQLVQTQTDLQHSLASAREQLTQQPVDTASKGVIGFYVGHQAQFDDLERHLPALQQNLGRYQTLSSQVDAAQATYDQQLADHPELTASLSPNKQAAVATLRATLQAGPNATTSRQARQTKTVGQIAGVDWRLIAGGIGLVAGIVLPLGAFKWVLMLAGLGLLGWFGWEQLGTGTSSDIKQAEPALVAQLTAAGFAPDLDRAAASQQLAALANLQQAQAVVTSAQQQLAAQAATVWQALKPYQFAADWVPVDESQLATSVDRVTTFFETMRQKLQTERLSGADFAFTQRQVQQLTTQHQAVAQKLQALAAEQHYVDVAALADAISAQAAAQTSAASLQKLTAQLTSAELTALQKFDSLSALQAEIAAVRAQATTAQATLTQQTAALVTAQTQLQRLTEDGRYTALRQQQANQQTEITVMARQWVTRQLGAAWIDQTLKQLTNQQLPAILSQATSYFVQLTGERYNEIKLVAEALVLTTTTGTEFAVAELSTATKEQLYLALRLALIVHLGEQAQLPIMIDDGFVNFDDQRRQVAWQLLEKVAATHQLLYFTNEKAALTQLSAAGIYQLT